MNTLTKLSEVHHKIEPGSFAELLIPCLSYESERWTKAQFGMKRVNTRKSVVTRTGLVLSGFIPRIIDYCTRFQVNCQLVGNAPEPPLTTMPELREIVLKDFQIGAIQSAQSKQRGVIQAPTGSGKTIIGMGIMASYPRDAMTFIVHSVSLLLQTEKELLRFFPEDKIGVIGNKQRDYHKPITVAMIQTVASDLKKKMPEALRWVVNLETLIVDECHHVSSFTGTYALFLSMAKKARRRFGLTATLPYKSEAKMALEGFIGQSIFTISPKALEKNFMIAKVKSILEKIPQDKNLREIRRYPELYDAGIVNNKVRNQRILARANQLVSEGRTVLIIVFKIDHGHNLMDMAESLYPQLDITYIHGGTDAEAREKVRLAFNKQEHKVVVTSLIWREGVNIPTLGAVINAAGGKSEIATIQAIGRGLRAVPGKEEVFLCDFFDNSHHYLISHFGERLSLYFDMGWI